MNKNNNIGNAAVVAYFDKESSKVYIVNAEEYGNGNFENSFAVNKLSDLKGLNIVAFANLDDFKSANPDSLIDAYINGEHSPKAKANMTMYITSFVHLYKLYKSLDAFTRNKYTMLIDAFIEDCISCNTDHPATIAYFDYEIHKAFRLRKTVYDMFKNYFNDYEMYKHVLSLQNRYEYTNKEFRKLKNKLKTQSEFAYEYEMPKKNIILESGLKIIA